MTASVLRRTSVLRLGLHLPRPVRIGVGVAFCVLVVVVCMLAGRRLTSTSWPLQQANVGLVLAASAAYLISFFLRALGWQRLFSGERPDRQVEWLARESGRLSARLGDSIAFGPGREVNPLQRPADVRGQ